MERMDVYWETVSALCTIVELYGTGYILYRFARPFIENKRGTLCIGLSYFATMLILYFVPIEINTFAAYSLGILSAFIVMCRMDRRNYRQKIFIAATFFSLRHLSVCMAGIITELICFVDKAFTRPNVLTENPVISVWWQGNIRGI